MIICLNPKCQTPNQRCLDNRTLRTHPSDCSRHYFSADSIISTNWNDISDYPSDLLGISVSKKINSSPKVVSKAPSSVFRKMINNFKQKIDKTFEIFENTIEQHIPYLRLEQLYTDTFSLEQISKYLCEKSNPDFISKLINSNFSHSKYGELERINTKLDSLISSFNNILSGFKVHLKSLLDQTLVFSKNTQNLPSNIFEPQPPKPKIQFGLQKSSYITSSKIECKNGSLIFPKLENIVSFMPWVYCDHSFNSGVHELKIRSLKFPSQINSGLCILQQHDIDTYPYHYFKSLFSKDGRGFNLVTEAEIDQFGEFADRSGVGKMTEIQNKIGQISEVIVRLQLNSKPRAIIKDSQSTSIYVCELNDGKKYRFGIYGSGWVIEVVHLY